MKQLSTYIIVGAIFVGCSAGQTNPNKAGYVTLLGNDTLAVEVFEKTEEGIHAKVILRSPRTTFNEYDLKYDGSWGIESLTRTSYSLDEGFSGEGRVTQTIENLGDSLSITTTGNNGTNTRVIAYERGVLPFIDMVHWPFEQALNNALRVGIDEVYQKMLAGSRIRDFVIRKLADDSMTIQHPTRGVMGVDIDENGNLAMLDAGQTTRKLVVRRVQGLDIDAIGQHFAAADKNGSPFGALSGAKNSNAVFWNVEFNLSYGAPLKRGRKLFGGIVPYGQRWRTGANRATHIKFSKDLIIGGNLEAPAGEYTLFTIPEEDGGILIINKQTGQNGRTYDEARDLGRVALKRTSQDEVTEDFTIKVEQDAETGGVIKLIWGQTVYSVDFVVK